MWDGFLLHCNELAATQAEGHVSNNCGSNDVVDRTEPNVTPFSPASDCVVGETFGSGQGMIPLPSDHWSDYFALNTAIYQSGGTYYINSGFFYSLIDTPEWLIEDYNVTSGSVAYALGLQSGDIPQTLNRIDISTVEGVMEAWGSLQAETEFEFVVLRGTSTVTLTYSVVSI